MLILKPAHILEGLCSHVKDLLSTHGIKPFLKCAAEVRPPSYTRKLPIADISQKVVDNADDILDENVY